MAISNTAISNSATPIFTSSGANAITTVIVCNVNTYVPATPLIGLTTLKMWAVPQADVSAGPLDKHLIVNGVDVPAGETFTFDNERLVLSNGDVLYAQAGALSTLVSTVSSLPV